MTVEENKKNDEAEIKRVIEGGGRGVSREGHRWDYVHLRAGTRVVRHRAPAAIRGSRCIQETLGRDVLVVPGSDRL